MDLERKIFRKGTRDPLSRHPGTLARQLDRAREYDGDHVTLAWILWLDGSDRHHCLERMELPTSLA